MKQIIHFCFAARGGVKCEVRVWKTKAAGGTGSGSVRVFIESSFFFQPDELSAQFLLYVHVTI